MALIIPKDNIAGNMLATGAKVASAAAMNTPEIKWTIGEPLEYHNIIEDKANRTAKA